MHRNSFARVAALAMLLLAGPGLSPCAEPALMDSSLLPHIVARLESDINALKLFSFREESRVEHRNRRGELRSHEQDLSEVYHQDGQRMRRSLVAERGASEPPPARADKEPSFDVKELASCFTFSQASFERLAERPALRLDFAARPGCLDVPGRAARILGNLDGQLWVDAEGFELLRIEGHLRSPVTFGFGILGKVDTFNLEVEREPVGPGVFAMTRLEYHAKGRMFPARRFDLLKRRDRSSFQRAEGETLSSGPRIPSQLPASDSDPTKRDRS